MSADATPERRRLAAGLVAVGLLAPLSLAAARWPSYWTG